MVTDQRLQSLKEWINTLTDWRDAAITVASADASFRRYFRLEKSGKRCIAMDAPPDKEETGPFLAITRRLHQTGVHVPEILAENSRDGFLLLEDLGNTAYLDQLDHEQADALYADAFDALLKIQQTDVSGMADYSAKLLEDEMQLMPEWFLQTHLGIEYGDQEERIIRDCFDYLLDEIARQPGVFVHRDYHSRNLMITETNNPGVIDYQDAVRGPVTYDLVSLLRDCYICWPGHQVQRWVLKFRDQAVSHGIIKPVSDERFIRDFDLMGLQRHIKVLGIFARLAHRDGKQGYLNDLPLTLSYVLNAGRRYTAVQPLIKLFETHHIPSRIGTIEIPE